MEKHGEGSTVHRERFWSARRFLPTLITVLVVPIALVLAFGHTVSERGDGYSFRTGSVSLDELTTFRPYYELFDRLAGKFEETDLRFSESNIGRRAPGEYPSMRYIFYTEARFLAIRERTLALEGVDCKELPDLQIDCSWNGIRIQVAGKDDQGIGDKAFLLLSSIKDTE